MRWSYAACQEPGPAAKVVLQPHGCKSQNNGIPDSYRRGSCIGPPLLVWMGGVITTGTFRRPTRWVRE